MLGHRGNVDLTRRRLDQTEPLEGSVIATRSENVVIGVGALVIPSRGDVEI